MDLKRNIMDFYFSALYYFYSYYFLVLVIFFDLFYFFSYYALIIYRMFINVKTTLLAHITTAYHFALYTWFKIDKYKYVIFVFMAITISTLARPVASATVPAPTFNRTALRHYMKTFVTPANAMAFCCRHWMNKNYHNHVSIQILCPDRFKGKEIHYCNLKLLDRTWYSHFQSVSAPRFDLSVRSQVVNVDTAVYYCNHCSKIKNFRCPLCKYNNLQNIAQSDPQTQVDWYTLVFEPYHVTISTSEYLQLNSFYGPATGFYYYTGLDNSKYYSYKDAVYCEYEEVDSDYAVQSAANQCIRVLRPTDGDCPGTSISPENQCDWAKVKRLEDSDFVVCIAPFRRSHDYPKQLRASTFCSQAHIANLPVLYDYLYNTTLPDLSNVLPQYLGYHENSACFGSLDVSVLENLLTSRVQHDLKSVMISDSPVKFVPRDVVNEIGATMEGTWFLDYYFPYYCSSEHVPYNATHSICREALYDKTKIFLPSELFRKYKLPYITHCIPAYQKQVFENVTCNIAKELGQCALKDLFTTSLDRINETTVQASAKGQQVVEDATLHISENINMTMLEFSRVLNASLLGTAEHFLNIMGANSTNNTYFHGAEGQYYGGIMNWLASIFGSLISPFYVGFKDVLAEILKLFVSLFNIWMEAFIDEFTTLIPNLAELFDSVLKLLVSVITIIESKILLFEYTALFLVVLHYFDRNTYFALTVVVIAMLVFGIVRRSPSFVLPFVSREYTLFNLSSYYNTKFDYDYKVYITNGDRFGIYYFKNATYSLV